MKLRVLMDPTSSGLQWVILHGPSLMSTFFWLHHKIRYGLHHIHSLRCEWSHSDTHERSERGSALHLFSQTGLWRRSNADEDFHTLFRARGGRFTSRNNIYVYCLLFAFFSMEAHDRVCCMTSVYCRNRAECMLKWMNALWFITRL